MSKAAVGDPALKIRLAMAKSENERLLDLLNAIIVSEGGVVAVPLVLTASVSRKPIVVSKTREALIVKREGEEPEEPKPAKRGVRGRLWLPGQ